jgi:hypothetical protein
MVALLDVMTDHERAVLLAYLAGRAPEVLGDAIAAVPSLDADELDDRLADAEDDELDRLDPYCSACGAPAGIFIGHGDGRHHYRGAGTVESPVELYDAGHDVAVAWRERAAVGQ